MKQARNLLVSCVCVVVAAGCAAAGGKEIWLDSPPDAAVEMQEKNIALLNNHIEMLNTRVAELETSPVPADPDLAAIHQCDLAGVRLRLELLNLLLTHSRYAKEKLLEARADPGRKQQILDEYLKRRGELMAELEVLDQRQDEQERNRMALGLQLIVNAFK